MISAPPESRGCDQRNDITPTAGPGARRVIVGADDRLIKGLYVEPAERVRKDWPVVEIKGGDHITCIIKSEFKEELATWLKKNAK